MREDESDRIIRQGQTAWENLKSEKNWNWWIMVGDALLIGSEWAMHQAGTNKREGRGYNAAMSEWLKEHEFADMDGGDRSRLFNCMDNRPAIEEWRATLPKGKSMSLNHPSTVWRNWKAHVEPVKPPSGKPTLRDSVANLSEETAAKDVHIAEIEANRETLKARIAELEEERDSLKARIAELEGVPEEAMG